MILAALSFKIWPLRWIFQTIKILCWWFVARVFLYIAQLNETQESANHQKKWVLSGSKLEKAFVTTDTISAKHNWSNKPLIQPLIANFKTNKLSQKNTISFPFKTEINFISFWLQEGPVQVIMKLFHPRLCNTCWIFDGVVRFKTFSQLSFDTFLTNISKHTFHMTTPFLAKFSKWTGHGRIRNVWHLLTHFNITTFFNTHIQFHIRSVWKDLSDIILQKHVFC